MIDVSDGLASEAMHLAYNSDKGVVIFDEKIPVDQETYSQARDFNIDASTAALNGGEDYELLLSISQSDYDKIKDTKHLTVIGHFTDKASGYTIVDRAGTVIPLKAQGWNHFDEQE
jgi:thiamine-monophosphate kinase